MGDTYLSMFKPLNNQQSISNKNNYDLINNSLKT
jgi:hypothetical protein